MGVPSSQALIERLVNEHYAALYRYAFRLAGSAADAEDLTQETFCKAHRSLEQLREVERAKPWLFRILRNVYLHRFRSAKQQPMLSIDCVGELPERMPDPLPDVDGERLQQALGELPEVYRTPIILYYFEEFSYRDIAEQMELPIGTVMSRLARGKAHLRGRLFPADAVAVSHPGRARDGL